MAIDRRMMLGGTAAMMALPGTVMAMDDTMYGMIGRIKAVPGQRDSLIALLLDGSRAMPGCLSYIVAKDLADPDTIWVTEAWDGKASHAASLTLPQVRAAIAKARPLIAAFDTSAETQPVGGVGPKRR